MDYITDYKDNYLPKQKDLESQKEMNTIMNTIRKSNFSFGEYKPDYNTSSRAAYKYNPEEAKNAHNKLGSDLLKDLRATHYRLGYNDDIGISTQKQDFIPYGVINEGRKDKMIEGNVNLSESVAFKGISIYKSDYTKKEIPHDENDCYC